MGKLPRISNVDTAIIGIPFDIQEAIEDIEKGSREIHERANRVISIGGDHTIALPLLRALASTHGPISVVHFDAPLDTWNTYFGAAYTHGTPFRRMSLLMLMFSTLRTHQAPEHPRQMGLPAVSCSLCCVRSRS